MIVDYDAWKKVYAKLQGYELDLVTESTYLKDQLGEHASFFVKDPNGYMLEFKTFKESKDIFKA